ncbi:hypothetical protein At1g04090-like [Cornus florida]|uniref:hypothetical protein At1g04090-like n=1 Tax=Cornus florida TaxID=4283 RepID=UPI00289F391E|nr:hypothetical protein At1g04090-like [Cornus florida]
MGNCLPQSKVLPIDTTFMLPSPIPTWPPGEGFGSGTIDLGGLLVTQVSSFSKVWATYEGGPGDLGATFFEPSSIPDGFFMLGCYSQPNNNPLFGWVLVGKDDDTSSDSQGQALKQPIDYTLVWNSESLEIKKDGDGYVWLPTPPDGYKAVGHVVTASPEKHSLDKIRCVRSDLTEQCEADEWIWGEDAESSSDGINVHGLRPSNRGTQALSGCVGTFIFQDSGTSSAILSLVCLKNNKLNLSSSMLNLSQIKALVKAYSPWIYFHPKETYLPSSVNWFFSNGALLYKHGEESKSVSVEPNGSNLPQGGSNDGLYWLDLPIDENAKDAVMKGEIGSSKAYLHIKPMLGATFTDIAMWIFYPFNGPLTAKIELINVPLGRIGEHIGDWEHLTLRISNFNGVLNNVYFSQHSGGTWVEAPLLEFHSGTNKAVAYSSLHGHANFPKPGLLLQGGLGVGIRNTPFKNLHVSQQMDTGTGYSVVAAENLGGKVVEEPPWLNYARKWEPKITYELGVEVEKVENSLNGEPKSAFESLVNLLPDEVFGEEGPTSPKMKNSWYGDEV